MTVGIKPWFSGSPVSVTADASALEAHDRMVEFGIRHLPVVDAEHRVVGVLSIDDLRAALPIALSRTAPSSPAERQQVLEWRVGDVMTYSPWTIRDNGSLREAADRMADHRIGCLPVVDAKGCLAGMLSETDLLRALATRTWADETSDESDEAGEIEGLADELRHERDRIVARLGAREGGEGERESLEGMAARRLDSLDRALDHVAQGRLSVCHRCGGSIPSTRLRALPDTTLCVACAGAEEIPLD